MSNVIPLSSVRARNSGRKHADTAAISRMFAVQRRRAGDVFWLKENAEWLGILASADMPVAPDALVPYASVYDRIEETIRFFPQYYRFFLSLALDLEDLGLPGDAGERLVHWVARMRLADGELSDLQRAEAQRLLARRMSVPRDDALQSRLRRFFTRSETFALPNKKASYELAHIVFYLSDYGQRAPQLPATAIRSLNFAGILAYLDQDMDLLADICAALRFAGAAAPALWEDAVQSAARACRIVPQQGGGPVDGYHAYLVTGWAAHMSGGAAFCQPVPQGAVAIRYTPPNGALQALSAALFDMGETRQAQWSLMRGRVMRALDPEAQEILTEAEASCPQFEAFFARFARAPIPAVASMVQRRH